MFCYQVVPCYTRAYFLQKYALARCENRVFAANLRTREGFNFAVKVTNEKGKLGHTYFSGRVWREFARVYLVEPGQEIYFTISEHGPTTLVSPETYPITHPCNFSTLCIFYYNSASFNAVSITISNMQVIMLIHNQHKFSCN